MKKCETSYTNNSIYVKVFSDDSLHCSLENVYRNMKHDMYNHEYNELTIDLTECSYLDSTNIGSLFAINNALLNKEKTLSIIAGDSIVNTLTIVSANKVFKVKNYFDILSTDGIDL